MWKKILITVITILALGSIAVAAYDSGPAVTQTVDTHTATEHDHGTEQHGASEAHGSGYSQNEAYSHDDSSNPEAGPGSHDDHPAVTITDDTPLTDVEIEALYKALDDEYHAWAVYGQVIDDFGQVRPFTNIQRSEAQHIAAVVELLNAYDLEVPENPWIGQIESYASVTEACTVGVEAEIVNASLYDELFASTSRPEILSVYERLQAASLNSHLPAFERCASR